MGLLGFSVKEANNLAIGQLGFDEISNTTTTPPSGMIYYALYVDTDATFTAVSNAGGDLSSQTRVAGQIVFGNFSSVTVSDTGTVLGYRAPKPSV